MKNELDIKRILPTDKRFADWYHRHYANNNDGKHFKKMFSYFTAFKAMFNYLNQDGPGGYDKRKTEMTDFFSSNNQQANNNNFFIRCNTFVEQGYLELHELKQAFKQASSEPVYQGVFSHLTKDIALLINQRLPLKDRISATLVNKDWHGFFQPELKLFHFSDKVKNSYANEVKNLCDYQADFLLTDQKQPHKERLEYLILAAAYSGKEELHDYFIRKYLQKNNDEKLPISCELCYLVNSRITSQIDNIQFTSDDDIVKVDEKSPRFYEPEKEQTGRILQALDFIEKNEQHDYLNDKKHLPLIFQPCPGGTPVFQAIRNKDFFMLINLLLPYVTGKEAFIKLWSELNDKKNSVQYKTMEQARSNLEQLTCEKIRIKPEQWQGKQSALTDETNQHKKAYISAIKNYYHALLNALFNNLEQIKEYDFIKNLIQAFNEARTQCVLNKEVLELKPTCVDMHVCNMSSLDFKEVQLSNQILEEEFELYLSMDELEDNSRLKFY